MFSDILVPLETAAGFGAWLLPNQNTSADVAGLEVLQVLRLQHDFTNGKHTGLFVWW